MSQPPESAHRLFEERFNAGDLDGMLALYEGDATFVRGPGDYVNSRAALAEGLRGFLATKGSIKLETRYAVQHGELALLSNEWTLTGTDADGKPFTMSGRTVEVVRRQADGRWLYVIDHPWGAQ
ncbi:MAG: SgcJ/EcaC family oxidoreductase [Gammaproteobacteria bacterium]